VSSRKQAIANSHSRSNTINFICDGYNCENYASNKIDVNAGTFGTISLDLCNNCVKKFVPTKDRGINRFE
jgi:hypothetical protein